MNKQELIKYFEDLPYVSVSQMGKKAFIDMIEQLDEPQKVTVPQFVADWIEKCKSEKRRLHTALNYTPFGVNGWVSNPDNQETFARAWFDGYEVEKEKRYIVKVKNIGDGWEYLKWNSVQHYWYFGNKARVDDVRLYHTLENLQKGGFGNVFVNPLFTIEEVPE